jgi:chromosome segregation ATPase
VKFSLGNTAKDRKRRYSDGGVINDSENADPQQHVTFASPSRGGMPTIITRPQTAAKPKRQKQTIQPSHIMTDDVDIGLLREALISKRSQNASLKIEVDEARRQAQSATEKLQLEKGEKEMMRLAKQELESQVSNLLERIEQMLEERRQQALLVTELQSQLSKKEGEAIAKEVEVSSAIAQLTQHVVTELESARVLAKERFAPLEVSFEAERQKAAHELSKVVGKLETTQEANTTLKSQVADLQTSVDEVSVRLTVVTASIAAIKDVASSESSTLTAEMDRHRNANYELNDEMITLKADLEAERTAHKEQVQLLEAANTDIVRLSNVNTDLNDKLELLQSNLSDITRISEEQATTLHDTDQTLQIAVEEKNVLTSQLSELHAMYNSAQEAEKVHTEEVAQLNATILRNDTQVTALNDMIAVMKSKIAALEDEVVTTKSEREEVVNMMESTTQQLSLARDEVSTHSAVVSKLESSINALQNERGYAKNNVASNVVVARHTFRGSRIKEINLLTDDDAKIVYKNFLQSLFGPHRFDVKLDSVTIKIKSRVKGENMVFICGF